MKTIALAALFSLPVFAGECRVLIDGTGCRTRQLAIQRILEKVPDVETVTIQPRAEAPLDNQRYFIVRSRGTSPTLGQLVEALGRRAKHYHILSVSEISGPPPTPRRSR